MNFMIIYCLIMCALFFLNSLKITVSKPLASLIDSLTHGEERGTAGRVRLGNAIFKSDHASQTAR